MNKEYYHAMFQIIKTGHWITDQVSKCLKDYGISEQQFNVLRILKGAGKEVTVSYIGEHMVQRNSNVTRIVDKLVAKKYCSRDIDPNNRRKMMIKITAEGEKELLNFNKVVDEFHKPYLNKLDKSELKTLKELIVKLKE